MTQERLDLPYNLPDDWAVPAFKRGEIAELVMREGERIIGSQVALVRGGFNDGPVLDRLKTGIACYRLGYLMETHRAAIHSAIKQVSRAGGKSDGAA